MPKHGKEHAYGPYHNADRNTWRVVLVRADGARASQSFESKAAADAYIERIRGAIDTRTLGAAVNAYLESLRVNGARPSSIVTAQLRLEGILRLKEGDRLLRGVTRRVCERLYADRVKSGVAVATHQSELGYLVRLFDHCRKLGWRSDNPAEEIEPVGTPSAGKPQLRFDEARRLLTLLIEDPSPIATAILMTLMMGLRAHEVIERIGRDVDRGGTLLWIPTSKTRAGVRQLTIPALLQPRIAKLVKGREEKLFDLTRHALHYHTVKAAAAAGVPRVTPHGLRGTFATLAITAAGGLQSLAPQFGHSDAGETLRRHYLAPGAEQSAQVVALETELQPEEFDAN